MALINEGHLQIIEELNNKIIVLL